MNMAVTIAGIHFDYHDYDERGDTLFLSVEKPSGEPGGDAYETPEGHSVEYDEQGTLFSIEFLNVRWLLEREGELRVTLPEHPAVATSHELETVLS
jgi:uncharacterized protein YuzE